MADTKIENWERREAPHFDLKSYYTGSDEYWKKQLASWVFERVFFYDNVVEFPDVYMESVEGTDKEGKDLIRHERFDGVEFQRGTNLDAESLGRLDQNIYMLALKVMGLEELVQEISMKLAISQGILINNMPYNQFVKSMKSSTDFKVLYGWYSPEGGWVAC